MTKFKKLVPLKQPVRIPEWIDRRTAVLLLIATIFLLTLVFTEPLQKTQPQDTGAATGVIITLDAESTSEIPPEWENNSEQTNGILLGGVILVFIIIIGAFSGMRRKNHS